MARGDYGGFFVPGSDPPQGFATAQGALDEVAALAGVAIKGLQVPAPRPAGMTGIVPRATSRRRSAALSQARSAASVARAGGRLTGCAATGASPRRRSASVCFAATGRSIDPAPAARAAQARSSNSPLGDRPAPHRAGPSAAAAPTASTAPRSANTRQPHRALFRRKPNSPRHQQANPFHGLEGKGLASHQASAGCERSTWRSMTAWSPGAATASADPDRLEVRPLLEPTIPSPPISCKLRSHLSPIANPVDGSERGRSGPRNGPLPRLAGLPEPNPQSGGADCNQQPDGPRRIGIRPNSPPGGRPPARWPVAEGFPAEPPPAPRPQPSLTREDGSCMRYGGRDYDWLHGRTPCASPPEGIEGHRGDAAARFHRPVAIARADIEQVALGAPAPAPPRLADVWFGSAIVPASHQALDCDREAEGKQGCQSRRAPGLQQRLAVLAQGCGARTLPSAPLWPGGCKRARRACCRKAHRQAWVRR